MVNLRIESIVCHLFSPSGTFLGLQILRRKGPAVECYNVTLTVLTLEP